MTITVRRGNVVRNAIGGVLEAYGAVAAAVFWVLSLRWSFAAPEFVFPGSQAAYPHISHGTVVYFTAFQATFCSLIILPALPIFLLGVFITPKTKRLEVPEGFFGRLSMVVKDDPHRIEIRAAAVGCVLALAVIFLAGPGVAVQLNELGIVLNYPP